VTDIAEKGSGWSGLRIIGAGFGRTGTLSTKTALEELGFGPCYHMVETFRIPGATELWEAVVSGEPIAWSTIFDGYQATVDWPGCTFYKELMQTYPDAKVLLTVRDPERWYESVTNTIYRAPNGVSADNPHARMLSALVWEGTFNGKFEDKDYAIAVFNRHNDEVRQYVPAEKLLVYNVKEGWEPLCAFLGVAVPDKPFPHLNDRDSFNERRSHLREMREQGASFFPEKR
jgi:Sulfotransferase domain